MNPRELFIIANDAWDSVEEGYSTREKGQEEDDKGGDDAPLMERLEVWGSTRV